MLQKKYGDVCELFCAHTVSNLITGSPFHDLDLDRCECHDPDRFLDGLRGDQRLYLYADLYFYLREPNSDTRVAALNFQAQWTDSIRTEDHSDGYLWSKVVGARFKGSRHNSKSEKESPM